MKDHQANWRPTDRLPTHAFQRHYLHLLNLRWMYGWCIARGLVVVCRRCRAARLFSCVARLWDASVSVVLDDTLIESNSFGLNFDWFDVWCARINAVINNFCCGFSQTVVICSFLMLIWLVMSFSLKICVQYICLRIMCLLLSKVCRQFKPIRQLILPIKIELVKWLGKFPSRFLCVQSTFDFMQKLDCEVHYFGRCK